MNFVHSEYIENLILRLCKQPRTFKFISNNLSSFDPVQLLKVLKSLESNERLINTNGLWHTRFNKQHEIDLSYNAKTKFFNEHIGFFGLFKKPHPLDFEWRNTTASLNYLMNEIQVISELDDKILLLGFPTLFATAFIRKIKRPITLVESNQPVVRKLENLIRGTDGYNIVQQNIFTMSSKNIKDYFLVIMDPPWYSPHFYHFMWLAAKCVKVGGIVGISLPPINTRPNIEKERLQWFTFCEKNGLCLENLIAQKLEYAMPFFEFNAFRAAGVTDILPFWRKGDLAFFRKTRKASTKKPVFKVPRARWKEIEIKNVRIRVKNENSTAEKTTLKISHLIKGDILPTISTRDPRRKRANIWTSGNRIFSVSDTKLFIKLLEHYSNNKIKLISQKIVAEFIETVTYLENREYNNYLEWLYHEMERQTA